MSRRHKLPALRRLHRWVGGLAAALLLVVTVSGIVLQHPDWLGSPPNPPLCLAADPHQPGRLLRGTHWGVETSVDGGSSWHEVPMLAPPTDVVRIVFAAGSADSGVVYALGAHTAVVSEDGGQVWRELLLPPGEVLVTARLLDIASDEAGRLDLLTTVGQFRRGEKGAWTAIGVPAAKAAARRHWVHDLHTGNLFGLAGRRVAEGGAWGLLVLIGSGSALYRRRGRGRK